MTEPKEEPDSIICPTDKNLLVVAQMIKGAANREEGFTPCEVMIMHNMLFGNGEGFCCGPDYGKKWIKKLKGRNDAKR